MRTVGTYDYEDIPAFVTELVYAITRHGTFVYDVSGFVNDGGKHFVVNNSPLDAIDLRAISRGLKRN